MTEYLDPRDALLDYLCDLVEEMLGSSDDPYERQKRAQLTRLRKRCGFIGSRPVQVWPVADSDGTDSA